MRLSAQRKTLVAVMFLNAADGIVSTIFPAFLKDAGFSVSSIGFVVSVFGILSLVSRLPSGLAYRPSLLKPLMYTMLVLLSISILLYPMFTESVPLAVLRALNGFALGASSTLNMALFMDTASTTRNRARAMALYSGLMAGGFAVGNYASGWIADNLGYETAFRIAALLPVLAIFFTAEVGQGAAMRHEKSGVRGKAAGSASFRSSLAYAKDPRIMIISLFAFSLNFLHYTMATFLPIYALSVGLNLSAVGFLRGLHSMFGTITRPFSGEAMRFASYDALSSLGLVALAAMIALIPSLKSMVALVPLFIVLGTTRGVVMVTNQVSLVEAVGADADKRGIGSGIFNTAKDLGMICGPILGGVVASYVGVEVMLRFVPAGLLAFYFASAVLGRVTGVLRPAVDDR